MSMWGGLWIKTLGPGNITHCASCCLSLETKVFGLSLFFLFKLPSTDFAPRVVLQSKNTYFPSCGKAVPLQVTCFWRS